VNVEVIRDLARLDQLLPEWLQLFENAENPTPFAHPLWLATWARYYVEPGQLYVLSLRRHGELVGVAPFHKRVRQVLGASALTRLQPLGRGDRGQVTELTQILADPVHTRGVLRATVQHLASVAAEWDWAEISVSPDQGWLEWEWVAEVGTGAPLIGNGMRVAVVLPLPRTSEELQASFKPSVKKSLRRGANRLRRGGHSAEFHWPEGDAELHAALGDLMHLHRARAALEGKRRHGDALSSDVNRQFLVEAFERLWRSGVLVPLVLRVDGSPAAARLVVRAHRSLFFSVSGLDPTWWDHGVGTTLVAKALCAATDRGDRVANLSQGPDASKLRWSEELELYKEFVLITPRKRSKLAFLAWSQRANVDALRKATMAARSSSGAPIQVDRGDTIVQPAERGSKQRVRV
jgi:CelD/BcsL family acetyltransferase involved in cellulose biosynthesis